METEPPTGMMAEPIMPFGRLGPIEASIADLTDAEKLELIARLARSIGRVAEVPLVTAERAASQHENLMRLIERTDALPSSPNEDGFSNRDHDKVLYGSPA